VRGNGKLEQKAKSEKKSCWFGIGYAKWTASMTDCAKGQFKSIVLLAH